MTSPKHLTFMFTDIVGSTALFSSLSPREADRVRGLHFQDLERALGATDGRLVKNLGDGAMAVFESCSQAMNCAVLLQQAAVTDRRLSGIAIELRIGLSTGEVTPEVDDYFGDPVVEAARLCALAAPGQILATSRVRAVAGRYVSELGESLGPKLLKGLPVAVEVEVVGWAPTEAVDFPPPPRLRRNPEFFGRSSERAMLGESLELASSEGTRLALVVGESGIGKSALATEFALSAHESSSAVVLLGRCEENLRSPFHPFEEALSHYVAHAPERLLTGYVKSHGSDLSRLVPSLGERLGDLPPLTSGDPDTERHALFRAVSSLLSMTSASHPVVLVLDDLHFADEDSLQLMRHLAMSPEAHRVLIVGTCRDGELGPMSALSGVIGSLTRQVEPIRIVLGGWTEVDVASFLQPDAEGPADESVLDLARLLTSESGGNPFFVTELLHHLSSQGAILKDAAGNWSLTGDISAKPLPASIHEVLAERMRPIGRRGQEVLQTAAVIGHDFQLELLASVTGVAEEELLDVLDAAVAASLIVEVPAGASPGDVGPSFSFRQAMIRRALHDSIGPSRRMLVHRRVAEALDAMASTGRPVTSADLAYHFAEAGSGHSLSAFAYSIKAAEEAAARLAFQEAVRHYEAAIALQRQLPSRDRSGDVDLLVALGTAQRQAGVGEYRRSLLSAARLAIEIGDDARLVQATLANSRGFTSVTGAVDSELVELLELALDRCAPDVAERALVLAALCSELQYHPDVERRRQLAREAEELCSALLDDRLAVTVTNRMFSSVQTSFDLAELVQRTESTLRSAERAGDQSQLFWARLWRSYALRSAGAEREACIQLAQASANATELGQPLLIWWSTNVAAVGALIAGDPDEAERLATEAHRLGIQSGQPDAGALFQAVRAGVMWQRGRLDELAPHVDAALERHPDDEGLLMTRALAYAEADDLDGCRGALAELRARIDQLPFASTLPIALTIYAEAAARAFDTGAALVLLDRLANWSDQVAHTGATTTGPVSHFLGGLCTILGRYDEAEEYYERSAVICEAISGSFFGARTALDRGVMLLARANPKERDRARSLVERALLVAKANGYATVERRAAGVLATLDETA